MTARQKFVCGNWKMHGTIEETERLLQRVISGWKEEYKKVEVAVCPPFTSLHTAREMLRSSGIQLGAQNCYHEVKGAFTGEISPVMLAEMECSYVILGHSERRTIFNEDSTLIAKKTIAALAAGLRPIVCVGESDEERIAHETHNVLRSQLTGSLTGVKDLSNITIAYEPVWAIGTGKTATPDQAGDTHRFIRDTLSQLYSPEIATSTRILYGGSVKAENARKLFSQPNIDGGLIGGASLEARTFLAIVDAAL